MSADGAFGPVRQGTRTTQPQSPQQDVLADDMRVIEVIPEKKMAFQVNQNGTIWSYELEPTMPARA